MISIHIWFVFHHNCAKFRHTGSGRHTYLRIFCILKNLLQHMILESMVFLGVRGCTCKTWLTIFGFEFESRDYNDRVGMCRTGSYHEPNFAHLLCKTRQYQWVVNQGSQCERSLSYILNWYSYHQVDNVFLMHTRKNIAVHVVCANWTKSF